MVLKELFVRLGLDVDEASFAKGQLAAGVIKAAFEKLADAASEVVEQVIEVIRGTAEAAEKIEHLSQSTGVGIDALQSIGTAADFAGVSIESVAQGLGFLSRNMYEASKGGEEQIKMFKSLGVSIKGADGKLRSVDAVFADISDSFNIMDDGAKKTALSMEVLGRAGKELIPLLNKGSEEIAKLSGLTPNLDEDEIKAGVDLIRQQKELAIVTSSLWKKAIAPILPAITELIQKYVTWRKENAAITGATITKYLGVLIKTIKALGSAVGVLIDFIKILKEQWVTAAVIMAAVLAPLIVETVALGIAAAGTAAAWLLMAAPFLIVAAAVGALLLVLDDINRYQQGKKSLFGDFKKAIDDWSQSGGKDPIWLRWIKDFVHTLHDAIVDWERFKKDLTFGVSEESLLGKRGKSGKLPTADNVAGRTAAKVLPWIYDPPQAEKQGPFSGGSSFAPDIPAPVESITSSGGNTYAPTFAPQITITAQPGQSNQSLGEDLQSHLETFWESKMEPANAALSGSK